MISKALVQIDFDHDPDFDLDSFSVAGETCVRGKMGKKKGARTLVPLSGVPALGLKKH